MTKSADEDAWMERMEYDGDDDNDGNKKKKKKRKRNLPIFTNIKLTLDLRAYYLSDALIQATANNPEHYHQEGEGRIHLGQISVVSILFLFRDCFAC